MGNDDIDKKQNKEPELLEAHSRTDVAEAKKLDDKVQNITKQQPKSKNLYIIALVVFAIVAVILGVYALMNRTQQSDTKDTAIMKQTREKLADRKKAVKDKPEDATARFNLGTSYYILDDKEAALREYKEAVKYDAKNAEYYNALGNTYRDLGKYEEAVNEYKRGIEINPKYENQYNNLAHVQMVNLNNKDEAIKVYDMAIKNTDNKVVYMIQKAGVYEMKKDTAAAKEVYNSILKIDQNNTAAKNALERLK